MTHSAHNTAPSVNGDLQQVVETHHIIEPYVYYRVFAALIILFTLTLVAAYFDLSQHLHWQPANLVVALTIAVLKAMVIVLYFMHLKFSSRLTQIFAGAALLWLSLMFVFTFSDYMTRSWTPQPATWTLSRQR